MPGSNSSKPSFVNAKNARIGHNYGNVISNIAKDGVCPFCPDQIAKYHKNPIEVGTYWLVTNNMYPYKPTKEHLILIHKTHIENISEITEPAWAEIKKIIDTESKKRDVAGGTFMLRFGDTHYTGASVSHLHAHLIQSDPEGAGYKEKKNFGDGLYVRIG